MPQNRLNHTEDHLIYEMWHRKASITRYLGDDIAGVLWSINLDHPEVNCLFACFRCQTTIALAEDTQQRDKAVSVTMGLAEDAGKPAYLIRYRKSEQANPAEPGYADIESFVVTPLIPKGEPMQQTPAQHAEWLAILHGQHWADCAKIPDRGLERLREAWRGRPYVHTQAPPDVELVDR